MKTGIWTSSGKERRERVDAVLAVVRLQLALHALAIVLVALLQAFQLRHVLTQLALRAELAHHQRDRREAGPAR